MSSLQSPSTFYMRLHLHCGESAVHVSSGVRKCWFACEKRKQSTGRCTFTNKQQTTPIRPGRHHSIHTQTTKILECYLAVIGVEMAEGSTNNIHLLLWCVCVYYIGVECT